MNSKRFFSVCAAAACLLAGCSGPKGLNFSGNSNGNAIGGITIPAYVPGPLDGLRTPRRNALRRPIGIILENYAPDSRPQSGLGAASTVIETLAEGGVTRFMAVYLENETTKVGPVRSTRMYFDRWAAGLHSVLVHVGGNDDAQAQLWRLPKVFNIDENRWEVNLYDTGTHLFWRSRNRLAPHNMYVNTRVLRRYVSRHGQNWFYSQASLEHKSPALLRTRGQRTTIDIHFTNPLGGPPNPNYAVHYVYDRRSDTYTRWMGGSPHVDAATGHVLRPANVVVLQTGHPFPDAAAGPTPQSILIPGLDGGRATYFVDGKVRYGWWKQANINAPLRFMDRRGRAIQFNPGQTWIEVAPASSPFTWSAR